MLLGLNGAALYFISLSKPFGAFLLLPVAIGLPLVMERVLPYETDWNNPHGDIRRNIAHVAGLAILYVPIPLSVPVLYALFPQVHVWPEHWPLAIQVLLAFFITDFCVTYIHYLSHKVNWLWRLHAIHHYAPRLYSLNGLVRHPLHLLLDLTLSMLPMVLLGMPYNVALLLSFAVTVQLLVQHANVDHELGPFRNWLAIGPVHRLHHVNWQGDGDVNFGMFTTVWDRLLGTFKLPEESARPAAGDIGIQGQSDYPQGYVSQLVEPFAIERAETTPLPQTH